MLRIAQKVITTVAMAAAAITPLAAGPATGLSPAAAEPLKIIYSDWPGWVPWEIAKEKGFFEKRGVEVELIWMDYVKGMEAFAVGQADAVCMTNGDALVIGATADKPSTAIIINDYSNGNDMIIARPGIDSIEDLKGKKVGVEVGFVCHLLLLTALEEHGMTEDDVELVNFPTNELPQALASGSVDAIAAWQPSSGKALEIVGGSKTLFTSADAPGIIYDLLYVARDSLAMRRDDWQKVVRAWYDVVDYMKDPANEQEMLQILSARVGLSPAEYKPLMRGTYIFSLEEVLPVWEPGNGLETLMGSDKNVDAFNLKYNVYSESEVSPRYHDASFTKQVAEERGVE